jgi:hypothetical protein
MLQVSSVGRKVWRHPLFSVRKATNGEQGSSIIELAIVMSFFLVPLIFGVTGVGMLIYESIEVSHAAHEGASYASQAFRANSSAFTTTSIANISTFAKAAEPNIPASALTTNPVTVTCGCLAAGSTAQVTGSCTTSLSSSYCSSSTPNLFVTVKTQANVAPLVSLSFLGFPATVQLNGVSTFELAP